MKASATIGFLFFFFPAIFINSQTRQAPKLISHCNGPMGEGYDCLNNEKGLVFRSYADSLRQGQFFENVVLPVKSTMNFKVNSAPMVVCDRSRSANRGRIYICWSDLKNGEKNEDVFLSFSDDKGKNWCEPVLLTWYPNHKAQIKPFIYCDPKNGRVYVAYLDSRNSREGTMFQTYLAISSNGGLKFDHYLISEEGQPLPYLDPRIKFNSDENALYAFWVEPMKKQSECWFRITDSTLSEALKSERKDEMKMLVGFKFAKRTEIRFTLQQDQKVTAVLTKPLDPKFEKVLFSDKEFKQGENVFIMEAEKLKLKRSSYTLILYYGKRQKFCWITEE